MADILSLSVAERIQLVEDIWDSVATESDAVELTSAQRAELDRRLADLDADPNSGQPWEEVKARLLGSP